jgi:hypothetical protein
LSLKVTGRSCASFEVSGPMGAMAVL